MAKGVILYGLPLLSSLAFADGAKIVIDASKVENHISPLLYGSCMEDVNHEIYGGLYDQRIFGESFEEAPGMVFKAFKDYAGNWIGADNTVSVSGGEGVKLVHDQVFSDGSIEVEMKFGEKKDVAGLIVRVSDPGKGGDNFNGYEISLNAKSKELFLGKHVKDWRPIHNVKVDIDPDQWHRLRVEMSGSRLRLFLDGGETALIDYTDNAGPLLEGSVGLRTWGADVSFRNLTIKTDGKTVTPKFDAEKTLLGMWDAIRDANATAAFIHDDSNPFNGRYSQKIEYSKGTGKVGVFNQSLNRWGIAVREGQSFEGRLYLRGKDFKGTVHVALQSADGSKTYAVQTINHITGDWAKYPFTLTTNATDNKARFAVWTEDTGTFWVDQAVLMSTGDSQFRGLPYRADIGNMMVAEGLTFLRYGGTMINAPEYRFKKMIGDPDKRPPYVGHWYRWSTNGFGIEDFLKYCEAAKFEASFAINIEETAQDAADMVEYLNGAVTTQWGKKRAENGHPEPYNVKYIQIGNEEVLFNLDDHSQYDHYVARFNALYDAMIKKDPSLKVVCALWWRPEMPEVMERVFRGIDGKAAYWDYHAGGDHPDAGRQITKEIPDMEAKFKKWNPDSTLKCVIFEENGNTHGMARALGHATNLNAVRRLGDFILTSCAANALQPYKQNDNGWDQGQIFFTPSQVWGMPPFYSQQMAANNHLPLRVSEQVSGDLDVTATCSEDGKTLVLHVVNTKKDVQNANVELKGFQRENSTVKVFTLSSGSLTDVNTPEEPERIKTRESEVQLSGDTFDYRFNGYSYTILRFSKQ